jgi:hypothetical protein
MAMTTFDHFDRLDASKAPNAPGTTEPGDPAGHRVLYVLGFGLAGAILSNSAVFLYFFALGSSC